MVIGESVGRCIHSSVRRAIDSVAGFSPLDISDLRLWLDASDTSTLTLRDSTYVEAWADKSDAGNNFSQATEARQPSWGANEVNFAASLVNLTAGSKYIFSTSDGLSIVALVQNPVTGLSQYFFDFGLYSIAGYGLSYSRSQVFGYVPYFSDIASISLDANYHRISSVIEFESAQKLYVDNAEVATEAITTTSLTASNINENPTPTGTAGPMTVGKLATTAEAQSFIGKMKQLLIYGKKLDLTERTALDNYLAAVP